jgi:cation diffusion facilitator family transporter
MTGTQEKKKVPYASDAGKPAVLSLVLNVFLTASKFSLYLYTGSAAVLAEAVHSLTDIIGSLLVIGGIYISGKKSEQFPWGLYKVENIAAAVSGGLIFLSAYEVAKMIYSPSREGIRNLDITIVALMLMAFPIILFSKYEIKKAKVLNSPSLKADAENWRMDLAPLAVVAFGLIGARLSYPVLDRVAAFIILVLVIRAGYGILMDSIKSLLDASVSGGTLNDIKAVIEGFPEVKEIISLNARNSGRFVFVYIDLSLSLRRLRAAHEIAVNIEKEIRDRIPFVEKVIIHYEPERKAYQRAAVPLADREGSISEHFGSAPFIVIWDRRISDSEELSLEILKNPFFAIEKGKGIRLAEFLVEKGVDVLYTAEDFEGKGPEHVLSDAEIEVRKTDLKHLNDLIKFNKNNFVTMEGKGNDKNRSKI